MRIGIGFDIHRLVRGRKLVLGGIHIPFEAGLLGHSDGDAALHAVADALAGALGKPDIGTLFPDTDKTTKDIPGGKIIAEYLKTLKQTGYEISNLDIVIIAEKPRLQPYYEKIRGNLAALLAVGPAKIGLKAKTMEGLGEIGAGKAIECRAVVLLEKTPKKRGIAAG